MYMYAEDMRIERPVSHSSLNLEAISAVRFAPPQMYFITSWTGDALCCFLLSLDNCHSNIIRYSLTAS